MSQSTIGLNILSNVVSGVISGTTQQIHTNGTGQLSVEIGGSNVSAFGDIITVNPTPVVQLDFVYGFNTQTSITAVTSTGVVDTSSGRLRLQTGTNSAGASTFTSRKIAKYRPGQGMLARFTPLFTTGVASSTQYMGAGNDTDGYFVGYSGNTFGIIHRINSADTFVSQTNWNVDTCDGNGQSGFNWDKTKGNVVQIFYPFLGYGAIRYYVLTEGGEWINFHNIRYPNSSTSIQVTNPSLSFYAQAKNAGNTSNLTMYCGSVGMFLCGDRSFGSSPKYGLDSSKNTITTETNLLTLKNATTYNGVPNRGLIRLNHITLTSNIAGANPSTIATFRLRLNPIIAGPTSFTAVNGTLSLSGATITNGNSIVSYDTAGTTVTSGGTVVFNCMANAQSTDTIDLTPFDIYIAPGETIAICGASTTSASLGVAVNWSEDI